MVRRAAGGVSMARRRMLVVLLAATVGAARQAEAQTARDAAPGGNRGTVPPKGPTPPLQAEPGDVWADVKGWDRQHQERMGRGGAPEKPPAPAAAAARPARPRTRSRKGG